VAGEVKKRSAAIQAGRGRHVGIVEKRKKKVLKVVAEKKGCHAAWQEKEVMAVKNATG